MSNNGIFMTNQQQIILNVIEGSEGHQDVDQLHRHAVDYHRTISITNVYRTVKLLELAVVIDWLELVMDIFVVRSLLSTMSI